MTSAVTTLPTYATGDTIEALTPNTLRDNDLVLDGRTGGDPGAAGKILSSNGTLSGTWLTQLFANFVDNQALANDVVDARVLANLSVATANIIDVAVTAAKLGSGVAVANIGYTPANKAGDTFADAISVVKASGSGVALTGLTISQTSGGTNGAAFIHQAVGAAGVFVGPIFGSWSWVILDNTASTVLFGIDNSGVPKLGSDTMWHAGNAPASADVHSVGTLTAAQLLARTNHTGTQLAATISDLSTAVALLTAASANAIADGAVSTTAKLANLIVTAAKIANATITDTQVAAANKDGTTSTASMRTLGTGSAQAAAGDHAHSLMAKVATGSYTGTGTGVSTGSLTVSSIGFTSGLIAISDTTTGTLMGFVQGGQVCSVDGAGSVGSGSLTLNSSGFVMLGTTAGLNVNGHHYTFTAFG